MTLSHRPATPADYPTICGFAQSAEELYYLYPKGQYPLTPAQLAEAVASRWDATVIERDGRVMAFANFYSCEPGVRCALGNVVVVPEERGQGVARYLIETMIALAVAKHHVTEVEVSCFNHNTAGLLLYPRLGFTPYAVEPRTDWQGLPAALVKFRLPTHDRLENQR